MGLFCGGSIQLWVCGINRFRKLLLNALEGGGGGVGGQTAQTMQKIEQLVICVNQ